MANMIHDGAQIAYLCLRNNGDELTDVPGYRRQPFGLAMISRGAHVDVEVGVPDVSDAEANEAVVVVTTASVALGEVFTDGERVDIEDIDLCRRTLGPGDSVTVEYNARHDGTMAPMGRYRFRNGNPKPERLSARNRSLTLAEVLREVKNAYLDLLRVFGIEKLCAIASRALRRFGRKTH